MIASSRYKERQAPMPRQFDEPFWIGDRYFSLEDLALIAETLRRFRRLGRSELVATLCENLPWTTAMGAPRLAACRKLLAAIEAADWMPVPPHAPHGGGDHLPTTKAIRSRISRSPPACLRCNPWWSPRWIPSICPSGTPPWRRFTPWAINKRLGRANSTGLCPGRGPSRYGSAAYASQRPPRNSKLAIPGLGGMRRRGRAVGPGLSTTAAF